MLEGGIPRPNHAVLRNGEEIGHVTSGTFSPLLKYGIAMAYIRTQAASLDETVNVRIRNKEIPAAIVRFPFYDTAAYGYSREGHS
jgi:aminomethyltransferase